MNVDWIRDRDPAAATRYPVVVELVGLDWRYLSTRAWTGSAWRDMGTGERVSAWLDGLALP